MYIGDVRLNHGRRLKGLETSGQLPELLHVDSYWELVRRHFVRLLLC